MVCAILLCLRDRIRLVTTRSQEKSTLIIPFLKVDGLTKVDEEGYTYEHYYGSKHFQQYGSDYK